MEENEKHFKKGFNSGYILSQHQPDLFAKISKGNENSQYNLGLTAGGKQYEKDKQRNHLKAVSKQVDKSKTNSKDIGKGR